MKIFMKQKLYILKSYARLVFNTFSFEPRKIEKILVYREVPKLLEITNEPLPSSPLLCFSAAAHDPPPAYGGRRPRPSGPPVDLKPAAWPASWLSLHLPHAPGLLVRHHAAPPCAAPLLPPPPRRRAVPGQTDLPRAPFASPWSPPAYK